MVIRLITTNAAETYWETAVAMATPATPILKPTTVMRLSITFIMPAMVKKRIGRWVSPTALSTAAPKLYTIKAGMPIKYMRRYSAA